MNHGGFIRGWRVEFLAREPRNITAVPDAQAKGFYRHRDTLLATNRLEVIRQLRLTSAVPVVVEEQKRRYPLFNRVSNETRLTVLVTMQSGVRAGMSPGRALEHVIESLDAGVRARLAIGLELLRRGESFLAVFEALDLFDETTLAIIEAGEETGKLSEALGGAIEHVQKGMATSKLLMGVLGVVAMDFVFAAGSVATTRTTLIPMLKDQAPNFGASPDSTALNHSLQMAASANDAMLVLTLGILGAIFFAVYAYFGRNEKIRRDIENLLLKVPVVRELMTHSAISRSFDVVANLLRGGVTMVPASEIAARASRLSPVTTYWGAVRTQVESGAATLAHPPLRSIEQAILIAAGDRAEQAEAYARIAALRGEYAAKSARKFTFVAFFLGGIYSAAGVFLTLFIVYVQSQAAMHGGG